MEYLRGLKVVRMSNGKMVSAVAGLRSMERNASLPMESEVEYFFGKARDRIVGRGPYGVFRSMSSAEIWMEDNRGIEDFYGSNGLDFRIASCLFSPSDDTSMYCECTELRCPYIPKGTVLADSVILIHAPFDEMDNAPWKKGYKVVSLADDGKTMQSAVFGRFVFGKGNELSYNFGRITRRKDNAGPIGVFESLSAAREFSSIENDPRYKLLTYPCLYKESKEKYFYFGSELSTASFLTRLADEVCLVDEDLDRWQ